MPNIKRNEGPYTLDKVTYNHKGKTITSIVNSPVFENIITNIDKAYSYDIAYIPPGLSNRPDLISNEYYGNPSNWWLVLLVNNISDPFESLEVSQKIVLPKNK